VTVWEGEGEWREVSREEWDAMQAKEARDE